MSLRGRELSEVTPYLASLAQVARIDRLVEDDGPARGARRVRLVTGGGLELEIHPDRGLDLGHVTIDGVPVAWASAAGITSPAHFDPSGTGWLRSFGGGFLTTCGLDTFGSPSTDHGVAYGQHGRISGTPATLETCRVDAGVLTVSGLVRQSAHLGEHLTLRRTIEADVGTTSFRIHDVVTNESSVATAHMLMYHANLGWPLVSPDARLHVPSTRVHPRDDASARELAAWRTFGPPVPGRADAVFLHEFDDTHDTDDTRVSVTLQNPAAGLRLQLDYDRRELPWLCQWKMTTLDAYVLGIEPVNTPTMISRADARQRGVLPVLEPGEQASYHLEFHLQREAPEPGPTSGNPRGR